MKFKFLEHRADAKFQAFGKSLEEAFSNSALAMFSLIVDKKIEKKRKKKIKVRGKDKEALLYNWLEELLFLFDSQQFILSKILKIKITEQKENKEDKEKFGLEAEIIGDRNENKKYQMIGNIKAVTYNEMFVRQEKGKVICQVVLDM